MVKHRTPTFERMESRRLLAGLAISEVQAANAGTLETRVRPSQNAAFGKTLTPDWIEIHNGTRNSIDLGGFHLTDSSNQPTKWEIPAGTNLPAGGYKIFYASQLNVRDARMDESGNLHTNFKLNPDGEYVGLTNADGETVHHFWMQPNQRVDVSWGVGTNGTGYLREPTPGRANSAVYEGIVDDVQFSAQRGIYRSAFRLNLTSAAANTEIWYTTDGTEPSQGNGVRYSDAIPINTTTTVRARAFKPGYLESKLSSHTFLFTTHVSTQNGNKMPATNWGHAGPDWEMDRDVVGHGNVSDRFVPSDLEVIPSVSLTLDPQRIFGSDGIYVAHESIEVPTSFEYFSNENTGVQAYATVQVVGGGSVIRWQADKLSLRVKFTEDVGDSHLDYSVFETGDEPTYNTLVLDARFNSSWTYGGEFDGANQRDRAQYARDQFTADLQNAVGSFASESRPVHLHINGIYWGMYVLHERPDDDFAAARFGGRDESYDVIKHNPNDIVSGTNTNYLRLLSTVRTNQAVLANYQEVEKLLDMDDYIRYMLVNFYVGNSDWARHNWYASFNRESDDGRWRFHSWDAEKTLTDNAVDVTTKNDLNGPTEIHQRLIRSPEYRLRFAEIAIELLSEEGVLGSRQAAQRYRELTSEIDSAIRAESARWGDNRRTQPYTRSDWQRQRDHLQQNFFPQRTARVIGQLQRHNLYPNTHSEPPTIFLDGSVSHGGNVSVGSVLTLGTNAGSVYYTINGTDPRQLGGQLSDSAEKYDRAITVHRPVLLRARARMSDGSWTPMVQADFVPHSVAANTNIRITEINFHPHEPRTVEFDAGFTDADDFEFIELMNVSNSTIDLRGVSLRKVEVGSRMNGVDFDFAGSDVIQLGPKERVLVVENKAAFEMRYGSDLIVAGEWDGKLSNDGEYLGLVSGDVAVHHFAYDNSWFAGADGRGATLQIADETVTDLSFWGTRENWRASHHTAGTPGRADTTRPGDSNHDGIFNSQDLIEIFRLAQYEDDVAMNSTFESGDWNGDAEFDTADMILAFTVGGYTAAARSIDFEDWLDRDARITTNDKPVGDELAVGPRDLSRGQLIDEVFVS